MEFIAHPWHQKIKEGIAARLVDKVQHLAVGLNKNLFQDLFFLAAIMQRGEASLSKEFN